jgi:hypothetical protein
MGDHPLIPGGHNFLDLRFESKVNVADAATPVPDAVRNAPVPTQNRVVSTQLAPGVFLVAAALGLAGTLVSLVLLWRRTADQRTAGARADGARASAAGEG